MNAPAGSLAGRVAFVTGAGSGIARATAMLLAAEGAEVACVDRDPGTAADTAAVIGGGGGRAVALTADVSSDAEVGSAVARCVAELGPPTIVLNAAGISWRQAMTETPPAEWRRVIETNLSGYFYVLHAVVPHMARAGGGTIVQVASTAAHIGMSSTAYAAAKGGVIAFTRQLAFELAPLGIRINSVSPGNTLTGMSGDRLSQPAIRAEVEAQTPLGRIATPEDIARAILFLLAGDSGYITGADLVVDGGLISVLRRSDQATPAVPGG